MPSKTLRRLLLAALLLLLGWLFWPHPEKTTVSSIPAPTPKAKRTAYIPSRSSLPGQPAVQAVQIPVPADPAERSPLADALNLPETPATADLGIVRQLLDEYRRAYGAFPVGEDNAQVLNALSGNNPKRLVFIARNHSAVSSKGELSDRWGTPYYFHFLSSQEVEIRSAGPDRELYSPDDLIRAPR